MNTSTNPAPSRLATMLKWTRIGYALPFLVLAVSLSITYQLWKQAQQNAIHDLQAAFNSRAHETGSHIEQRIATYEQVLRGADGLFAHASSVTRNEFHDYVARLRLEENYPGIQGMGFVLISPPAQKDQQIAAMRKEGFPAYTIEPEGKRDIYTHIIYIEPFNERNQRTLGYDMYSDREYHRAGDSAHGLRYAAMAQARDSGTDAISGKVKLLVELETDNNPQAGTLMYLPVYKHGIPHATLAERRANIVGWVYASFRMSNLMAGILGKRTDRLDLEIYDGEKLSDKTLMYDDDNRNGNTSASLFRTILPLKVDSHSWTMVVSSLPGFDALLDKEKPRIIANTGIGISLLLALLTWLLVYGRAHAMKTAQQVAESEARLKETFENLNSGVVICRVSPDGQDFTITSLNQAVERTEKVSREDMIGKNMVKAFPGITAFDLIEVLRRVWESGLAEYLPPVFYQDERISGWREGYAYKLRCGQIVVIYDDVTERKQAEEQAHYLARHDALTGLPNRTLLSDRVSQAIAKAKRDKTCLAILFIDLDMFKPINDDLGHDIGDQVLKKIAKRLQDCMRESDTAARIGGDEFVVLLPIIEEEQDAMAVAEKIRHALCQPFELAGHSICISSSIGIAIYPGHGSEEDVLIKNADIAMYHAKKNGRNNVQFYQPGMKEYGG